MENQDILRNELAERDRMIEKLERKIEERDKKMDFVQGVVLDIQTRQTNAEARQTVHEQTTAQNFAIVHQRINIVEGFVLFSLEQIAAMQEQMKKEGKAAAKDIDLKDFLKIEFPGDREHIKALWGGEIAEFEAAYQKASSGTILGLLETAINGTMTTLFANKVDKAKISPEDREKLGTAFFSALIPEIFESKASNTILAVATTVVKLSVIIIRHVIAAQKRGKVQKEIMSSWAEDMPVIIERMKGCLKEGVVFEEMIKKYSDNYSYNYGRNDTERSGQAQRTFRKIPDFVQNIPIASYDFERLISVYWAEHSKIFNLEEYLRDDLSEEKKGKFKYNLEVYLAFHKKGKFQDYASCGDTFWKGRLATSILTIPLGFGLLYGFISGIDRINDVRMWRNNSIRLKEKLQDCIHNHSSKVLEDILKKIDCLSRIKFYADASGSEVAKDFYEETLKNLYLHVKEGKLELFKEVLDLYCKLTNTGFANPKNLLEYAYVNELAPPHKLPGSEIVISAVNALRDSIKTIQPSTTATHESVLTTTNANGDMVRTGTKLTVPNQFLGAIDNILGSYQPKQIAATA